MTRRPIIFVVDDDAAVLGAVVRDLRERYAKDYRLLSADSAQSALEAMAELRTRGDIVALIISDQRMPVMEGTRLLEAAHALHPGAKTVLLTAYADTQAAIDAINQVGLDHYLMKPWDPPAERLYPVLDDLLADWRASTYLPWDGIRVFGTAWSARTHELKSFLGRQRIPFHYADLESDFTAAAALAERTGGALDGGDVPAVLFPDGTLLRKPELRELAARVGLTTQAERDHYDLIIVGAGPAGLAASVYSAAEGVRCLLIEKGEIGGLASTSPKIENYLGFPAGIAGADLTRRARDQAVRLGVEIASLMEVTKVSVQESYRVATLAGGRELSATCVLVATGAAFRQLPAKNAARYAGAGLFYAAAHSEVAACEGKDIFVVGGGNSAAQAALMLGKAARKVYLLIRGVRPTASKYLLDALDEHPRVQLMPETNVEEIVGGDRIEEVIVTRGPSGQTSQETIPASALFVFIGVRPASDVVKGLCTLSDKGFLLTGPQLMTAGKRPAAWPLARDPMLLETSVPGIFAAGDVRAGTIGRVAWAAGEGGAATTMVLEYLHGWETGSRGAVEG